MSSLKFIRLSSSIINPKYIEQITVKENLYIISLSNRSISGTGIFSLGWINSSVTEFAICSNKNTEDYKIITKWLDDNTFKC